MKFYIFYVNKKSGHRYVAEAITEYINLINPNVEIEHIVLENFHNIFTYLPKLCFSFQRVTPQIWNFLHDFNFGKKIVSIFQGVLYNYFLRKKINDIKDNNTDKFICVHAFPNYLLSYAKKIGFIDKKLIAVITDYSVHPYWITQETDLYLTPCQDTAKQLMSYSIPAEKIRITGIPVRKQITPIDPKIAKLKLNLNPDKKLILLIGGGLGILPYEKILEVLKDEKNYQIICITGNNIRKFKNLYKKYKNNVYILGFINDISLYLNACDIIITKPGGIILSEILSIGKPFILIQQIYGQEKKNEIYILKNNLGVRCKNLNTLPLLIKKIERMPVPIQKNNAGIKCAEYLLN